MYVSRILIALTLIAAAVLPGPVSAATASSRAAIKSMPITERPNRVGHFYGNTVRRVHNRRGS
jgi:hypothetical protein